MPLIYWALTDRSMVEGGSKVKGTLRLGSEEWVLHSGQDTGGFPPAWKVPGLSLADVLELTVSGSIISGTSHSHGRLL